MTEFSIDDLRLIRAMCMTACPQYPRIPMYDAFADVYDKAGAELHRRDIEKTYGPALVDHVLKQEQRQDCPDYCSHPDCN